MTCEKCAFYAKIISFLFGFYFALTIFVVSKPFIMTTQAIFLSEQQSSEVRAEYWISQLKQLPFVYNVRPIYKSLIDRTIIGATCNPNISLNLYKTFERLVLAGFDCEIVDDLYIRITF